jgi:hypothetical protein
MLRIYASTVPYWSMVAEFSCVSGIGPSICNSSTANHRTDVTWFLSFVLLPVPVPAKVLLVSAASATEDTCTQYVQVVVLRSLRFGVEMVGLGFDEVPRAALAVEVRYQCIRGSTSLLDGTSHWLDQSTTTWHLYATSLAVTLVEKGTSNTSRLEEAALVLKGMSASDNVAKRTQGLI